MPSVGVLVYNWQEESLAYFQNQRVRIAFARGIDRLSAVSRTMGGLAIPAQSPLIPGSWAYDSSAVFPEFNLDSARSMLETVDFESTPEPTPTQEEPPSEETASIRRHFSILVLNSPHLAALAEDLAQQWNALGFTVTVETVDDGMYQQRLVNGEFDTAIVEYSFAPYADPDPYTFWHVSQYKTGANYGGMRDLPISNVLERARREALGINRVQLYEEFQRLFVERAPALTLYHPLYIYIVDSRMEGIQLGFISTPADRFTNIQYWQWQ